MTNEHQILAGIEELANQLNEIKKQLKSNTPIQETNEPLTDKLTALETLMKSTFESSLKNNQQLTEISTVYQRMLGSMTNTPKEVIHNYIELKHADKWFWGTFSYFVVSSFLILFLINGNLNKKQQLVRANANDLKYRYLKILNEPVVHLKAIANNTTELVYYFDALYNESPDDFRSYVQKREEQIRVAFEASEIAKQKEAEAREAKEKARQLNKVLE